jgi:hypothetical protein
MTNMPNTQRAGRGVLSEIDIAEPGAVAMGACQLRQNVRGALGHRWRERDRQKRAGEDHQPRDGVAPGALAGSVPGPSLTAAARLRAAPDHRCDPWPASAAVIERLLRTSCSRAALASLYRGPGRARPQPKQVLPVNSKLTVS